MFIVTTIVDTIRLPPHTLSLPTLQALHNEIDLKYPNRVLMDVGLVICRYGECLKISNGSCVPGDGGCHHECVFRLVVFRPFVEEVLLGKIAKSTPDGIQVKLGDFFQDIHIPAYWMLRPSKFDEKSGLWVWSPDYGNDGDEQEDGDDDDDDERQKIDGDNNQDEEEEQHYEMELHSEIRFKVKSIHFTQVTNTAKGVQATTTTTAHSYSFPKTNATGTGGSKDQAGDDGKEGDPDAIHPVSLRKRSTSVDLSDNLQRPASMHIVASICEDGLGLTSWWTGGDGDDD
ncbi:DNA-directed RNA polymerase [Nitzschia inconspicua]|uniref:DNA-directed RNA polymerase n=1 Tax=Nitzschia inconspicua TaxID=303405 RepID=A0A9K3KQ02_9STRA|nr:DNA-directed RNA polymerase [Nitzschia inconspicua]